MGNIYSGANPLASFSVKTKSESTEEGLKLMVESPLMFTNLLALRSKLDEHEHHNRVILDLTLSKVIDHTSHEHLNKLRLEAKGKGRTIEIKFSEKHVPFSDHPQAGLRQVSSVPRIVSNRNS